MSTIKVNNIQSRTGNAISFTSGDTITIPSGATLTNNGTTNIGITEADQWRLTATLSSNTDPISANLERVDTAGQGYLGTGMSVSSGIWTFPSTGIWRVSATCRGYVTASDTLNFQIQATIDNSSYISVAQGAIGDSGSARVSTSTTCTLIDVTDTSNVKVKFSTNSFTSGLFEGSTTQNLTFFEFIRLGDT